MAEEIKEEPKQLTPEEMAIRKQRMIDFYKDQIEFLTHQKNYEAVLTEIEELRTRRLFALVKQAEIQTPAPQEEEDKKEEGVMPNVATNQVSPEPEPASKEAKRTLKKPVEHGH